jgi:hypothetical protein
MMQLLGEALALTALLALCLHWWRTGVATCGESLGAACFGVLIVALCFVPGAFPLNLILLLIPAGYWGFRALRGTGDKRTLAFLRAEDRLRLERTLARDPHNAAAHAALGQLLEEGGFRAEAVEAYEESLRYERDQIDIRTRLKRLKDKLALEESGQIHCPGCWTIQPPTRGICWKCGRVFDERAHILFRFSLLGAKGWAALWLTLFGIALALVSFTVPDEARTLLIVVRAGGALVGGGAGLWLYRAYRVAEPDDD